MGAGSGSRCLSAKLDFSGLSLRHLAPSTMLSTFGVRTLDLSNNSIESIGPVLMLLSLTDLNLSQNNIKDNVAQLFRLLRLQRLNLRCNDMILQHGSHEIPASLQKSTC